MFRLVESISKDPVRFPIKPGVRLVPGQIVMLTDYQGDLVLDICQGYNPLGILGNRCWGGSTLNFTKKGNVYLQRMIADVSKFDRENNIEIGDSLYCNDSGVFTSSRPFFDSLVLAKVISPGNNKKKHMQILWL